MDVAPTNARLARKRSAADTDRRERRYTGNTSRAAYSARAFNRADRQAVKTALRTATR